MQSGQFSRKALQTARFRAVHQVLDGGAVFADPLAMRILGADAEAAVRDARNQPSKLIIRIFIASRSRLAEDALAATVARGVRQLVVLGAGLDTYAYRSNLGQRLRIFEVDHPATQAWKRERLAAAEIPVPGALTFVPVDFERGTLADGLAAVDFDPTQETFFTWLGVVPYLTEEAIFSTLTFIAHLPGGAHVVFDYLNPSVSEKTRAPHEALTSRVADVDEPFLSFFESNSLHARLNILGFREIEDLGPAQIAARFFSNCVTTASEQGAHILRASTIPRKFTGK